MIRYIFLIALGLMPLCLLVMMVLGLIMLFSSKSKNELKAVKGGIAAAAVLCGISMATALLIFVTHMS